MSGNTQNPPPAPLEAEDLDRTLAVVVDVGVVKLDLRHAEPDQVEKLVLDPIHLEGAHGLQGGQPALVAAIDPGADALLLGAGDER